MLILSNNSCLGLFQNPQNENQKTNVFASERNFPPLFFKPAGATNEALQISFSGLKRSRTSSSYVSAEEDRQDLPSDLGFNAPKSGDRFVPGSGVSIQARGLTKMRNSPTLRRIGVETTSSKSDSRLDRVSVLEPIGPYSFIRELNPAQKHCLQKFINLCMKHGKKNKSYKIISNTLWRLAISEGPFGLILLMKAIDNVKPIIEVKKVRISGTTQLVPSILPKNRQRSLAIRWILEAAIQRRNTKKSMTLDQCLLAELMDAAQNIGAVRKRRDDLHKLAESNRGFAHYRWW